MWTLTRIEIYKIFKRPRTYIAFGAITVIVLLIQMALLSSGENYLDFTMGSVAKDFVIEGNKLNGYFVCYVILQTLLIHVPLLIALIAGDAVAGEANMGTLRMLLSRPISRAQFILSKFFASSVYTFFLLLWMAILALFLSLLFFGTDDMINIKSNGITIIPATDVFWRYILAFLFAMIAMLTVGALSLFLSVFADNSIGPIIATMAIIIVFTILSTMGLPLFEKVKEYLFTTYMLGWKGFFDVKVNIDNEIIQGTIENLPAVLNAAGILIIHIMIFVGAAAWFFNRKDILS